MRQCPLIKVRNFLNPVVIKNQALSYSVRRYFVDEFYFRHASWLPTGGLVLDLGGHKRGKRGEFDISRYDLKVLYANLSPSKGTDVEADALHVPFASGSFDVVICAELLEHVRHPDAVLHEAFRLLRREGKLLVTVPFLFRIHADPYDFGRYTDYYWRQLLEEIGFGDIVIERQGLFYSVLVNFGKQYANQLLTFRLFGRVTRLLTSRLLISPLQRWALRHEQNPSVQTNSFLSSFTTGFGIVAVKK